ncbi:MAG TPA: EVE domain-containing protein [Dehalococcoidia bacterium]|nr:EVE domain-containing protein [Dehalococcoidia bacterium]
MAHWIVVGSEQNMRIAEARGFDMFGFKSTRKNEVAGMKPGDRIIFYLTKIMKFGGIAEVTSDYYEDHEKVFSSAKKPNEDYPWRVKIKEVITLTSDQYLDVREIGPTMDYVKKWPAEHWRLAFQGNLHEIPESDYKRIESLMKEAAKVKA